MCGRYAVCVCVCVCCVCEARGSDGLSRCRVNEGTEGILFREKFTDWPEPGRIIKMKGHISSGEFVVIAHTVNAAK